MENFLIFIHSILLYRHFYEIFSSRSFAIKWNLYYKAERKKFIFSFNYDKAWELCLTEINFSLHSKQASKQTRVKEFNILFSSVIKHIEITWVSDFIDYDSAWILHFPCYFGNKEINPSSSHVLLFRWDTLRVYEKWVCALHNILNIETDLSSVEMNEHFKQGQFNKRNSLHHSWCAFVSYLNPVGN